MDRGEQGEGADANRHGASGMGARSGAALGSESGSGAARGLAPEQVQRLRCLRRELHPPIRIRRPGGALLQGAALAAGEGGWGARVC